MNLKMWLFSALTLTLATSLACGGQDEGALTPAPDASAAEDAGVEPDATDEDGGQVETDPLVLVPPTPLERTAADVCPAAFLTAAPAAGQNAGFEAGGIERSFHLKLPDPEVFEGPRPLLVLFNGTGGDGASEIERDGADTLNEEGWIVLGPDSAGLGTVWPVWDGMRAPGDENRENQDLQFFDRLLDCVAAHHPVDAKRVYIGGKSAGGIMTNFILRNRSELIAGAIPASSVFSLTGPSPPVALTPLITIVTWGGDNDEYSGTAEGMDADVEVPKINFVEQASLASVHYEQAPGVHQIYCHGVDLGHAWLSMVEDWMYDTLLAHPKGLADNPHFQFNPPVTDQVVCSEDAFVSVSTVQVECPEATTQQACSSYCQFLGDCVVENDTVRPVLGPQISALGFTGEEGQECGGCVSRCEEDATAGGEADEAALGCLSDAFDVAFCSSGVEGAYPLIDAVNECCVDRGDSAVCGRICTSLLSNTVAASFFSEGCAVFAQD